MARVTRDFGKNKGSYGKEIEAMREEFNALLDELDDMRTKYAAALAKLDADATVTDTNYAATCGLAAQKAKKVK